jgi:uncharacterized protein (UPF0210 family)
MQSINTKSAEVVSYALEKAQSLYDTSELQTEIDEAAESLRTFYTELLSAGRALPNVELSCKKKTPCEKVSYGSERKAYTKKAKAIKKAAKKLVVLALKGQANKKQRKQALKALNKKTRQALKKVGKVSKKSYNCLDHQNSE